MIYLQTFRMPAREDEEAFFSADPRNQRTCYTTKYPFHVFRYRQLPEFTFEPVTCTALRFTGYGCWSESTDMFSIRELLIYEQ